MLEEEKYSEIHFKVLEIIKPNKEEYEKLQNEFQALKKQIISLLDEKKIQASIELGGSFSRDTWLSGDLDLDIFVKLPYNSEIEPEEIISIIRKGINLPWEKRHANHPYLYAKKNDLEIEIIPSYKLIKGKKLRSPVDRSIQHKEFIIEHLPAGSNDEVRLLKQFMKGIGTYGAEIKIHGFSGYLIELLTIYFDGKFLEVLKHIKDLPGQVVKFSDEKTCDITKFNDEPLVVIDPTDKNRNVASAVKIQALSEFIAAAENYLANPSLNYFFPKELIIDKKEITLIENSELKLFGLIHRKPAVAEDILWGQIRRFEKSLKNYLIQEGYNPTKIASIEKDQKIITLIVSLYENTPTIQVREGPPVDNPEQKNFLEKYTSNHSVVYGPIVVENYWIVVEKKESIPIQEAIRIAIEKNLIAIPSHLHLDKNSFEIFNKKELINKFKEDNEIMRFLFLNITGKTRYLLK